MTDQPFEDWEGEVGERWLANIDSFESMIAPVGEALLDQASFRTGERIADIGCGCGANSFDIARAVGPEGRVTGIDVSEMLLGKARERLAASGLDNLAFVRADAETDTPTDIPFDRLFSRFGVMFFDDTAAAFANMRRWLVPGGDFLFACWAAPEHNPWLGLVGSVVGRHADLPERDPDAPGPFRLADPDATSRMLSSAGFENVGLALWRGEQHLGGAGATPESAAEVVLTGLGMREPLGKAGPGAIESARADLVEALTPHYRDGSVQMDAAAWFVTARNPAA